MSKNTSNLLSKACLAYIIAGMAFLHIGCKKDSKSPVKLPVVKTISLTGELCSNIICNGLVLDNGGGKITACGMCWSTSQNPVIADPHTTDSMHINDSLNIDSFISHPDNFIPNRDYYLRAYATNSAGTSYGSTILISIDIDSNVYHTVLIGTQLWMVENLKVTRYRNGNPLLNITDNSIWINYNKGGYCNYNNDATKGILYGRLYNWYSIADTNNICPVGWRLPNSNDWSVLVTYLGGNDVAGGKMKEKGTDHWFAPNTGADNSSGFTALPAGNCGYGGTVSMGSSCGFWSDTSNRFTRGLLYNSAFLAGEGNDYSVLGLSVRCLK